MTERRGLWREEETEKWERERGGEGRKRGREREGERGIEQINRCAMSLVVNTCPGLVLSYD